MPNNYDIFISYKRKSLATANNLYYRLSTRGYSAFFDLEEMRRDNFDVQLLNYIENAKDVFVILEEGSLDACKTPDWEKDWFCHEIAFALEKKKNIIPILLGDYKMPSEDFFPDRLKELSLKHSPDFSFSFFDAYLDKLIEKKFITSEAHIQNKATSVFKFYSNENCLVLKEGKLVCSLEGMSDEPYYLPVPRKGDYRFKAINAITAEQKVFREHIDSEEDKEIEIVWEERKQTDAGVITVPTSATTPSSIHPKAVPANSTHEYFDASLMDSMSDAEKIAYLRKWAVQGDSDVQYYLGNLYYDGNGVDVDYAEVVKWYGKAAEQGHADAQYKLGEMYYIGRGVRKNKSEAVKWYQKAAEQGHADAQYKLGKMYYYGYGVSAKRSEAVKWYGKAAEQGHADAQYKLGEMYCYGRGVKEDMAEAVKWYRKAAEQGSADAQYKLGMMYDYGWGVKEDKAEAVKWYRKAAEQGHADAQYKLGEMYYYGYGVRAKMSEAVKWYRKAAEQGRADAQYKLGMMYDYGWGVKEDKAEAVKWYRKSAEQGNKEAKKRMIQLTIKTKIKAILR